MEIYNRNQISAYTSQGQAANTIKIGDISPMVMKERTGPNEAKVQLKGQELTVHFDGPMPADDRSLVQVTNQDENGQFTVKILTNSHTAPASRTADDILRNAGFDPTTNPELKEAANLILSNGGTVSKDEVGNIQEFLKNDIGTINEKLETISIMQQKNLEFTKSQLHAVNTALHGASLTDSLMDLTGGSLEIPDFQSAGVTNESDSINRIIASLDPVQDVELIADMKKAQQIEQAGRERILQALPDSDLKEQLKQETNLAKIIQVLKKQPLPQNVENAINDALKLEKIGQERLEAALKAVSGTTIEEPARTVVNEIIRLIQKEPSLGNVLDGVKQLLDTPTNIDLTGLNTALEKATQLFGQGRELAARKELAQAVKQLQENNPQLQKNSEDLSKTERYLINEAVQSLQLDSKNILVTQITKKLSQLAIDFKKMRQEVSKSLDSAMKLMETNKGTVVSAKQMLESAINKLDQAILKGNFLLYTDMSTEKKLLTASSRLAEARNLLTKGNIAEAKQIVQEIKTDVDGLIFKPSDSRVKHFISEQDLLSPKRMLEDAVHPMNSARNVFETIKKLGLTHETDAANFLIHKEEAPENMKSMLLQMLEGQAKPSTEQALASLTGQQLLNKQDSSGVQNLFMQLPILLNKQVENVKVYVNSQKKGGKVDWENCNLTFLLETKKLGEIGISVSVVNRNLSITFKNNQEELQERVEPLMDGTKERLREIGYHVGALQFKPLSVENENVEKPVPKTAAFTAKGYDFTI